MMIVNNCARSSSTQQFRGDTRIFKIVCLIEDAGMEWMEEMNDQFSSENNVS